MLLKCSWAPWGHIDLWCAVNYGPWDVNASLPHKLRQSHSSSERSELETCLPLFPLSLTTILEIVLSSKETFFLTLPWLISVSSLLAASPHALFALNLLGATLTRNTLSSLYLIKRDAGYQWCGAWSETACVWGGILDKLPNSLSINILNHRWRH